MQDFKNLKVWEKSHRIALKTYRLTQAFPKEEMFGLTSQMRRAAISIPSNIAEGCGRETQTELARFLHIASGSLSELEYQTMLARDLGYLSSGEHSEIEQDIVELKKMMHALAQKIKENGGS